MPPMPRFAANISMLFTERPLLERFAAAKAAGFDAVEILFPYDVARPRLRAAQRAADVPVVLINTPPTDWDKGARGFAAVPGAQRRFQSDFKRALRYAEVLEAGIIHVMSGIAQGPEAWGTLVENLRWATALAPGQRLAIEPLNPVSMPGYFLNDYDLAAEVIDAVGAPNLTLQYDAFHAQMLTGDALAVWQGQGGRAGHVQIADVPGRVAPGLGGQIDFTALFAALGAGGYDGYVSAEYLPGDAGTEAELGWMQRA